MPLLTPEERIGTSVGTYVLDRMIGEGGMGVVFEGRHAALKTRVAIKLLHPHLVRDERTAKRFEQEAHAAAKIRHPNVVRILDFLQADDGAACIVMDLLEGESLTERMRRGRVTPEEAAEMLLPIMEALGHMHAAGIVHRDLKPDNIFLSREAGKIVPKLLDFGIAKVLDGSASVTRTGMVMGTPAYMAPEQARGAKNIGPGVDIWAMGIVWFEILSGKIPFSADGPQAILASILTERPPPLKTVAHNVPPNLAVVVDTALSAKPEQRFSSMDAFGTALKEAWSGRHADVTSPSTPSIPVTSLSPSPVSGTGPMSPSGPISPSGDNPLADAGTFDTLLADPDDPTRASGAQPTHAPVDRAPDVRSQTPQPQIARGAAVMNPVTRQRPARRRAAMLGVAVTALGAVALFMIVRPDARSEATLSVPNGAVSPASTPNAIPGTGGLAEVDDAEVDGSDTDPATEADAAVDADNDTEARPPATAMMRPRMRPSMAAVVSMSMESMESMQSTERELPETLREFSIARTMRINAPRFISMCQAMNSGPRAVPAVIVTFTVRPDGSVDPTAIAFRNRRINVGLANCVRARVRLLRFDHAQNPTTVTRTITLMR